ncbi:MAG: LysR family transcriptional regulator [Hyphomonadaceae bacterium]|nr:LysR family transcriptional regulator [Hyphomonadaceae bacterium]
MSIVDSGSIARASARLNVSQPAASRQVLALEVELGVQLFDRIGRRLRLTSHGEDLLQQSRQLLMEADVLSARARALKGGHTGILRVGATPMVIEHMLSAFLGKYQVRHAGVEVHFVEDGGLRLPSRLEHSDIHLALIVPDDRFRSRLLFPSHNLAVLSSKHRLSRRRVLEVEELAQEPLLLLHRTFGSRHWLDSAFNIAHLRPRVLLESAAPHTLIALAEIGYGVAVVPSTVLVPARLRALPLVQRKASIGRWVTIAWDPRRSLSAYGEQFVDELVAYCRRDYPGRSTIQRAPQLPRPKRSA